MTELAACARQGTHETLEEAAARAARRNETAEEAKRRLEADSAKAREALRCSPSTVTLRSGTKLCRLWKRQGRDLDLRLHDV